MAGRRRELDFLRGVAIILVLFRHKHLFAFTDKMGWIGVDLFFVLSGFLVSGLLFKEYLKYGNINPKLFLIRRGFKIYPIFYLSLIPFILLIIISKGKFSLVNFISEIFFVQNYVTGFGWALYGISWSLAVEEHFYFGFGIILYYSLRNKWVELNYANTLSPDTFIKVIFIVFIVCNLLRLLHNVFNGDDFERNFTMTHLRIDSLMMGVLVSYCFYFRYDALKAFYKKSKVYFIITPILLLSFTPFIEPLQSFFVKTIGFTMIYIAFGLVLSLFLVSKSINKWLDILIGKRLVDYISRIGIDSYAIYIVHKFILMVIHKIYDENLYLSFLLYFFLSVYTGRLITLYVESYFLRIRDKYFPSRVN